MAFVTALSVVPPRTRRRKPALGQLALRSTVGGGSPSPDTLTAYEPNLDRSAALLVFTTILPCILSERQPSATQPRATQPKTSTTAGSTCWCAPPFAINPLVPPILRVATQCHPAHHQHHGRIHFLGQGPSLRFWCAPPFCHESSRAAHFKCGSRAPAAQRQDPYLLAGTFSRDRC